MQSREPSLIDFFGRGAIFRQSSNKIGKIVITDSWIVVIRRTMMRAITLPHLAVLPWTDISYFILSWSDCSRYSLAEISPL